MLLWGELYLGFCCLSITRAIEFMSYGLSKLPVIIKKGTSLNVGDCSQAALTPPAPPRSPSQGASIPRGHTCYENWKIYGGAGFVLAAL
ncbi:uncharacterized protein BO87DRAFT_76806 [Aspergillus neoniger CBS 115656]|uniref:Uncharacterized protein n=1 Tax=Aspergillus neoniger (strain CBS 115656) TaxID=1448310 RepID=A0A318YW36_ASPNB|nr:hypothetical protein BO87DRAFT_76806 [Aspergillus neoniger CBS 115656]PYH39081.1 hypothetical protein BO87DRAFT_76806 [Aspergillus neoniger CBS 115656]